MAEGWDQEARERAYTALCEAVSAAGRENESLLLARLVLLLSERLADAEGLGEALAEAAAFDYAGAGSRSKDPAGCRATTRSGGHDGEGP